MKERATVLNVVLKCNTYAALSEGQQIAALNFQCFPADTTALYINNLSMEKRMPLKLLVRATPGRRWTEDMYYPAIRSSFLTRRPKKRWPIAAHTFHLCLPRRRDKTLSLFLQCIFECQFNYNFRKLCSKSLKICKMALNCVSIYFTF